MTRLRLLTGLIVLAVVGTFPALAQTPQKTYIFLPGNSQIVASGMTTSAIGSVTQLSGGVTIQIDGVKIQAAEGDIELGKNEIRLRGDVRIQIR